MSAVAEFSHNGDDVVCWISTTAQMFTQKWLQHLACSSLCFCRNMARRNVSLLLSNLPEDPDCSDLLEIRPVQDGDFREGLRPGIDVTVHAKAGIPAGAVLGLYRNFTVTKSEERIVQDNPPEMFEGTTNEWCQKLDAYTADIEQPYPSYRQSKRNFGHIYEEALEVWPKHFNQHLTGLDQ